METIALQLRNIYGGTPLELCYLGGITEICSEFALCSVCAPGNVIGLRCILILCSGKLL